MAVPSGPVDTRREGGSRPGSSLRLQILGPLRLWRDGVELDAGPRQQAYLLALLLAREGRPISTAELVDLIWGEEAPASALNVLHKYIGALRRLLEPALPVRGTGSYLLRQGQRLPVHRRSRTLDLVSFRKFVAAADAAVSEHSHETALDHYVDALGLWNGPAGDGLAQGPAAMSIFAGLNDEFFDACTAAAELAVSLGRPERVLAPLQSGRHDWRRCTNRCKPASSPPWVPPGARLRLCRSSAPSAPGSPKSSASIPARRWRPPTGECSPGPSTVAPRDGLRP